MKWIIVTGDSRGLGLEIVKVILKNEEYNVIGISRSHSDSVKEVQHQFQDRYVHINYDLSNADGIKGLYLKELRKYQNIVGFVNNAAYAYDDLATNANYENLSGMFSVNVFSSIMMCKYVIRDFLLNSIDGSIVHISSVCAHTGYKGLSMYAASKGAIEAFSKNIAREWGSKKVRSNCVAPGFMETEMSAGLSEEQKNRIYKRTSLKAETSASSVAETVFFLLSDKALSITGQVYHVDNGTI